MPSAVWRRRSKFAMETPRGLPSEVAMFATNAIEAAGMVSQALCVYQPSE